MSSYIGVEPATSFTGLIKQDFSVSATTSYTLSHSVNNANDIALYINFVRQEPTTAYSCSNTTLTLTSATAGSDDMYCIYLGQALQTVNPSSASVGNSQVAPSIITGQTNENTANDSDTILVYDDSATALRKQTRANFLSGVGGANTPNFKVDLSGNISVANSTNVKITWDVEQWDTASAFASNKFTVPSGQGGKYFFHAQYIMADLGGSDKQMQIKLFKNGSEISYAYNRGEKDRTCEVNTVLNLNASDYIEVYARQNGGSTVNLLTDANGTHFLGFKLIE